MTKVNTNTSEPSPQDRDDAATAWLTQDHEGVCVSAVLPKDTKARDTEKKQLELKNMLNDAEQQLEALDVRSADARRSLTEARKLLDEPEPWRDGAEGIAIYATPDETRTLAVHRRVEPVLMVADKRLYALPFVAAESIRDGYALCLSQGSVRLVRLPGKGESSEELAAPTLDLSKGFEELEKYIDEEKQLQFHTSDASRLPSGAERAAAFHGQGAAGDERPTKKWLTDFCHLVDDAIDETLGDRTPPIILFAAEPLHSMYAQTTRYKRLIADEPLGNADHLSDHEVRERIKPMLADMNNGERLATIMASAKDADIAAYDLNEIVTAAADGKIARLMVTLGARQWGRYDEQARKVSLDDEPHAGSEELHNLAALYTARAGGTVHLVDASEAPMDGDLAAILRY